MKKAPKVESVEPVTVRLITMKGDGFTDGAGQQHPWGHEFAMAAGAELDQLLADGVVRVDDRGQVPPVAQPEQSEEVSDGE